jgi:hypothetical protein
MRSLPEGDRRPLAVTEVAQLRNLGPAARESVRATGMETAPRRRVCRARHLSGYDHAATAGFDDRIGDRHRREQRLGVGMLRRPVERVPLGYFDNTAEIHYRYPIAYVTHHREIMRDEQIG